MSKSWPPRPSPQESRLVAQSSGAAMLTILVLSSVGSVDLRDLGTLAVPALLYVILQVFFRVGVRVSGLPRRKRAWAFLV
ncbi:hypothetical protein KMZ32_01795 [Phycicoccus sp. MAQZ13P-2]|uniref:hypothetical protein n=1 Tax=Phycicoccus mangrovi TaxID=2840470 RepID=UPI001C001038|nr:hypothetical protein [Phycicoccus mangrovi]MBT9254425.1 hypothetical protein [Phycicoccus mangrovi]MBT9272803.1 hypothetical protein [Phycicoccus mangrovi]